ncbi:hypothetical protein FOA52_013206 [Chlamydomonas sp. UWO 241]|nr:hypothetical protein FOA52_013206 [Chlamydomonas sp. UWO 241]
MEAPAHARLAVLAKQLQAAPSDNMQRLTLNPCSAGDSAGYQRRNTADSDVVIVSSLRTPLCKAKRGGLRDTDAIDMLAAVMKGVLDQTGVNPADIGDIVIGSVLGASSQRANECRIASFFAGIPEHVPVHTVNRQCSSGLQFPFKLPGLPPAAGGRGGAKDITVNSQCSSGLQAIASVAAAINAGYYAVGLAGGVETMSNNPMSWDGGINPKLAQFPKAQSCMIPMGVTSENVAEKFGVDRVTQDTFAMASHRKAAAAQAAGKFKKEIVPVRTKHIDPKTKEETQVTISEDDGIRADISMATLAKLPTVFKKGGSTTPGNASQLTDGAGATLLMTRREAVRRGLPILGVFRSFAAVGVDPALMGIGPAAAIPVAVAQAGLTLDDIDVFEINEAFASQATYCVKHLGLDEAKVNPNGGAIALGHPLGATGARLTATLLHEMQRRGRAARFGVVSMCIGSGMGAAAVFEAGDQADALTTSRAVSGQNNLSRSAVV